MYVEDALKQVFETFEPDVLIDFFRTIGVRTLNPLKRNYDIQADASFFCIPYLLGTIRLENEEELAIFTVKVIKSLTERSGKKAQYELAKKILKTENRYPAGIFIFHDDKNDFRFSLVYNIPLATGKRDWSNFRRYTYFVSKEQTNKTFIHQIAQADFSSIETLTEAFSVEKVTKAFYAELQNWYFWAMNIVEFPDDEDKDKNSRNAKNLIRLITRIIFIWFMKEKRLIPSSLFEKQFVDNLLNYNDKTGSTYYKAILQNLFFATLNTKMRKDDSKSRIFVEDAQKMGYISDAYLQQGYYRYSRFIKDKEKFIKEFENIPFLNGGLFECLDKKIDEKEVRIDCFSDNPKNETRLKVPDVIFFSEEEVDADLSAFLENNNRRKVRGLIPILNNYNFTTDENTPIDEEVALDPELLGKVFENLLASYNPETAVTARKATGSYYTPREIVDYMVTESLVMHLAGTLGDEPKTIEKLNKLFSYSDDSNLFDAEETESIISSIEKIRILDPACGSGAFPMGILHKLVLALHKLDPQNTKWKKRLIEGVPPELQAEVEQSLQNKSLDYIRKLGLIEHCIFGVDIQEIAIQISKLRFFISLLIEQEIDDSKENRDIRALPNLETKFVAANTLIELGESQSFKSQEVINLEEELFIVRERIFYTNSRKEKHELQRKLTDIRNQLKTELARVGFQNDKAEKITQWDPFDQNTHAEWFDPEWMFGIKKEEVKKTLKAFNITWVTHNSRRREFDMPSLTHGEKPIILNFEERNIIAQLLAQRIKEKKYRILAMNVLSDHVHLLLISDQKDVPTIVGDLKGYVSRMFHSLASASATTGTTASVSVSVSATHGLTRGLQESQSSDSQSGATYSDGTQLKLWARGYSDTFIDNDLHFANAITYIEHNHIKHELPSIDFSLVKDALTPSEKAFAPIYVETGFDIVIGNPPYIQLQKAFDAKRKYADLYKNQNLKTFDRTGDIYCLFYEKGINLLCDGGHLSLITSNKWMRAGYGEKLRQFFNSYNPKILIDLGPGVFENATVDTNILIIQKAKNQHGLHAVTINEKKKDNIDFSTLLEQNGVILQNLTGDAWFIGSDAEQRLKEKIERIGKPLKDWDVNIYRGILTGLNEAFIINNARRKEILDNCKDEAERRRTEAIIKPILRGRDIKRYYYEWAGLWVIVIPSGWTNENRNKENAENFINNQFPALMNHLKQFETKAKKRDDQGDYWWELRACAYYPEFEKEKVVWSDISTIPTFCILPKRIFFNNTVYMVIYRNDKFLAAVLNSNITKWIFPKIASDIGESGQRYFKIFVEKIPVPPITPSNQPIVSQIESLVDKILAAKKENPQADTGTWEREIDGLVYKLYELTEEEIRIIEGGK